MFKQPSHRFLFVFLFYFGQIASIYRSLHVRSFVRLSICLPVVSHKGRSSLHRLMPAFNPQAALLNPTYICSLLLAFLMVARTR